jgi:hypothetical protein
MKNRFRVILITVVIYAVMASLCSAACADYGFSQKTNTGYGFSPSSNTGYGFGESRKSDCTDPAPSRNSAAGNGARLTLSFQGYIDIPDNSAGSWNAYVSGGTAPYRYVWNLERVGTISTSNTAHYSFKTQGRGGRGNLTLTVWDSAGQCIQESRLIVVKAGNGQFPQYGLWGF